MEKPCIYAVKKGGRTAQQTNLFAEIYIIGSGVCIAPFKYPSMNKTAQILERLCL